MSLSALTSVDYSCLHQSSWLLNTNSHYNNIFKSFTDITSSRYQSARWSINYTGIVDYDIILSDADITTLNSRPKASSEFSTGKTTAEAGKLLVWGENIGYTKGCDGYWPPGPVCPSAGSFSKNFNIVPAEEASLGGCYVPNGPQGYFVNGAAIFSWADSTSYNSAGVWNNLAPFFEMYDMDVCQGHSAMGTYHHHNYPPCLAEKLGDRGIDHSPIYGFANDGFPVHGPWQKSGILAKSCYAKRDFSAASVTGCADGTRSCVLKDIFDYTKGSTTVAKGPVEGSTVSTQSGNKISSDVGIYLEDYFYNASCFADEESALNKFNGHDHDGHGFHYHMTIDFMGTPTFPFVLGPVFYGCVSGGKCCASRTDCKGTSVCGSSAAVPIANAQCLATSALSATASPKTVTTTTDYVVAVNTTAAASLASFKNATKTAATSSGAITEQESSLQGFRYHRRINLRGV